jgi:hypothetical protein
MRPLSDDQPPLPRLNGVVSTAPCPISGTDGSIGVELGKISPSASQSAAFALDDTETPHRLSAEQLRRWSERYDTEHRQLRRWVKRGETTDDPCPLDNPCDMPAWWTRNMRHTVPTKILAAAKSHAVARQSMEASVAAVQNDTAPVENPDADKPIHRDFSDIETLDLAANVEQLRRALAINLRLLTEAQQSANENLLGIRQRAYKDTFDLLRKAENDLIEWQREHEILVRRDEVRAENNRIASTIHIAVQRLVKRVRPLLFGKTDGEQDQIWSAETAACFAAVKTARFTSLDPNEVTGS